MGQSMQKQNRFGQLLKTLRVGFQDFPNIKKAYGTRCSLYAPIILVDTMCLGLSILLPINLYSSTNWNKDVM